MNKKNEKKVQKVKYNRVKKKKESSYNLFNRDEQNFFLSAQQETEHIIEKFADEQLDYFNSNPTVYNLEEYRIFKGLPSKTYYSWLEKSAYLKRIHDFCLEVLALRRKKRVAEHDPKFLTHTLHMYCHRHDEANKYKARLRNIEEASKPQEIKVTFEDYRINKEDSKKDEE